tara:strand:+ start:63 stop:584 length:522 start_codon:yes stop_codon:yes gene_type:complete
MTGMASGHSQEVYTVVYSESGAAPADIPNGTITNHESVWFWMKDSTENASLVVTLSKGDKVFSSPNLTESCEVDDVGNKVDGDCETRFDFSFNMAGSVGLWTIEFTKSVNGAEVDSEFGSVYVIEESPTHVENDQDSLLTLRNIAYGVAILSFIGMLFMSVSILKNQALSEDE